MRSENPSRLRPAPALGSQERRGVVIALLDARPMTGDLKDATRNVGYVDFRKQWTGFDPPAELHGRMDGRDMAF